MKTPPNTDPKPPADAGPAPESTATPEGAPSAPSVSPSPAEKAESELAAAKAATAALDDRIRRQQAEFVNDSKRIQRQADERVKFAVQPVVSDLLGVVDALHGAIEGLKDSEHEKRVADGLRMVEKELFDVLGRHGVTRIEAIGKPFDPTVHEAILEVDGPGPARTVVQVTRPGFMLHGRVVRASHVIVTKAAGGPAALTADAESDSGESAKNPS